MESRKVQAVGSSTLAVSLPKAWTKARNLKKGDQLLMFQEGDCLKLMDSSSVKDAEGRSSPEYIINADLCQEPGMLERIIVGNYVLGREKWTVQSKTRLKSQQHREIRNVSWKLIGLGIIEEKSDSMSLQCSIDPSKYPIGGLVNRLSSLSLMMFDESVRLEDQVLGGRLERDIFDYLRYLMQHIDQLPDSIRFGNNTTEPVLPEKVEVPPKSCTT